MTKPRDNGEMASLNSLSDDDKGFSGSQTGTSSLFETRGYSSFQTRYASGFGSKNGMSARRSSYTISDVRDYVEQLKMYIRNEYPKGEIFPDTEHIGHVLHTINEYFSDIKLAVTGESFECDTPLGPESPLQSKPEGTGSRDIFIDFRGWVAKGTQNAQKKFLYRQKAD